ncbi:MAG: C1 family peptidase [Nitrososphaerota archaeon]
MYSLGCKPDPKDPRDLLLRNFVPRIYLPAEISYKKQMMSVRDQGQEGTCVGHAVAAVKEWQDSQERRISNLILSPRYIYYWSKQEDGFPNEEGTYIRIALKVICERGTCEESLLPYQAYQKVTITEKMNENAKQYKGIAYARLISINDMKHSLLLNGPFVAGVQVFEDWMSNKGEIIKKNSSMSMGSHAICFVGYNDDERCFVFKNSWGINWGDHGYGKLSYDYVNSYCQDAWSLTDLIEIVQTAEKIRNN